MRFYRWWRRFRQQVRPDSSLEMPSGRPTRTPHDYLALNEIEGPPLPRRNRAVSIVYPPLPAKSTSLYSNDPRAEYTVREPRPAAAKVSGAALYATRNPAPVSGAAPCLVSALTGQPSRGTPPAADARMPPIPTSSVAANTVGLPTVCTADSQPAVDDLFPKGPIGDVVKGGPRL